MKLGQKFPQLIIAVAFVLAGSWYGRVSAADTNVMWGNFSPDGVRCGLKQLPIVFPGNPEIELIADTSSNTLVRVNLPGPTRLFAVTLRDGEGKSVPRSLDALHQGKALASHVPFAGISHDWKSLQSSVPRPVYSLRPASFFKIKTPGNYELEVELRLYLYDGTKYFKNLYLPPVKMKVFLSSN